MKGRKHKGYGASPCREFGRQVSSAIAVDLERDRALGLKNNMLYLTIDHAAFPVVPSCQGMQSMQQQS